MSANPKRRALWRRRRCRLAGLPAWARAAPRRRRRKLLILVELKGGNDALNTVVPYRRPALRAPAPAPGHRRATRW
jgi:uncharacterized protein (DUF1501 family)